MGLIVIGVVIMLLLSTFVYRMWVVRKLRYLSVYLWLWLLMLLLMGGVEYFLNFLTEWGKLNYNYISALLVQY